LRRRQRGKGWRPLPTGERGRRLGRLVLLVACTLGCRGWGRTDPQAGREATMHNQRRQKA